MILQPPPKNINGMPLEGYIRELARWLYDVYRRLNSAQTAGFRLVTFSVSLSDADATVFVDTTAGSVTVTLPNALNQAGKLMNIKKLVAANTLTVSGYSGQTIDGSASLTITLPLVSVALVSNGANWFIV